MKIICDCGKVVHDQRPVPAPDGVNVLESVQLWVVEDLPIKGPGIIYMLPCTNCGREVIRVQLVG